MEEEECRRDEELSISARRTESLDGPLISELVSKDTQRLFGRVNVAHIIEKANLSVSIVDEHNILVGHGAFYDQPNWSIDKSMRWVDWLRSNFNVSHCDPINTLFMHYFVSKEQFSRGITNEIIRTVFFAVPLLQYIVVIIPDEEEIGEPLGEVFTKLEKMDDNSTQYQAFVCLRHNHCPMLHIRGARIEDHDDLMPIFNAHNQHLTEIYGDFFLAELIEAQDEENKCIVADVDGTAVGFMSVSTNVNTTVLYENFELEVFNHFIQTIEKTKEIKKKKERPQTLRT